MIRRLSSGNADTLPLDSTRPALFQEMVHLLQGHAVVTGVLLAGAIAVVAPQVAGIGDVNRHPVATPRPASSKQPGRKWLDSPKEEPCAPSFGGLADLAAERCWEERFQVVMLVEMPPQKLRPPVQPGRHMRFKVLEIGIVADHNFPL